MFLRRSSSLRFVRPSPRANSERRDLETLGISLFGDTIGRKVVEERKGRKEIGFSPGKGFEG